MIIWGGSYILVKGVYEYINPITTVYFRVIIATFFLFLLGMILGKLKPIKKKDIKWFLILGLLDPFGYFLLEGYGLKYTSASISALVISIIPVILPVIAWFTLKEKISKRTFIGLIISFAGVLFVVLENGLTSSGINIGIVFLLMAVAASVSYNIILKKLLNSYNIYTIIFLLNFISSIYFTPVYFLIFGSEISSISWNTELLSSLLILGIFASSLAFLFYAKGVQVLGVGITNIFANIIPVITVLFAWLFLSEEITFTILLGIVLVVSGLFTAQLQFRGIRGRYGRILYPHQVKRFQSKLKKQRLGILSISRIRNN
jgi:drug/metabolite transporter (DMT)-like permease